MANAKQFSRMSQNVRQLNSFKIGPETQKSLISNFFTALDTDLSHQIREKFLSGDHKSILEMSIDPSSYTDGQLFKRDFAALNFLRKADFLETGIDTKQVALDNFSKNEERCKSTNRRFRHLLSDPTYIGQNSTLLEALRKKIAHVLGRFSAEEFFDLGSWGPGVTTLVRGSDTSAVRKFHDEREITSSLYRLVGPYLNAAYPGWFQDGPSRLVFRESSKLITVPKNAKTDRTIAVEPGFNIWFQKALGKMIRRRLRRYGYDLDSNSKSWNLALLGSLMNDVATVDFDSASDNIARLVIEYLFPEDWYFVLDSCRSQYVAHADGSIHKLNKFSSMGNGFTFELESLIFVLAAEVVSEAIGGRRESISVFGDDITIDSTCFPAFASFTSFLGFSVSKEKSFYDGPFRESCGAYYFKGICCKPYFLRKPIRELRSVYKFANGVRHLAHRHNNYYGCDSRFRPLHAQTISLIPEPLRFKGNSLSGDGCIHTSWDEALPDLIRAKHGFEGFLHKCFVETPVKKESDSPAVLLARLRYASTDRASGNGYELRAATTTRCKNVLVQQWYDLGPWY